MQQYVKLEQLTVRNIALAVRKVYISIKNCKSGKTVNEI